MSRSPDILTLVASTAAYDATLAGLRRAHTIRNRIGAPSVGDAVRIVEDGDTGRGCFARVTFVEQLEGLPGVLPIFVVSIDVRLSTSSMPAVRP